MTTCAALLMTGRGDDSATGVRGAGGEPGAETADGSSASPAATVSYPYTVDQVNSVLGTGVQVIATKGENDMCSFGTPGGSYPIDSSQPFVTVSAKGGYMCRFDDLDPGLLPLKGGYEPVREWGDGAWKVVLPSAESSDRGEGAEGSAYLEIQGSCVEVLVDYQGERVEGVDGRLAELVDLAR